MIHRAEELLRYTVAWLFGGLFLLVVVGIPIVLVVTSTYGLGDRVRSILEEKLGGKFYTVDLDRVLFSPRRGFIIPRLEIHDVTSTHRTIASARSITVSFNLEAMLRREFRLERIALRDASLDIPLGIGDEPRMRLNHVRGVVLCTKDQITVSSASFQIAGIQVLLSGTFQNPNLFAPKPVSKQGPGNTAVTLDQIQRELKSVDWETAPPVLTIQASGNLENSDSLQVDRATFKAGAGTWRGVRVHQLDLDLQYKERILTLQKAFVDDGSGSLNATGWADFAAKKASLEFAGAFNAGVFPTLFLSRQRADDWKMTDPVRLNGTFSATWPAGPPVLDGQAELECGRFSYRGVSFNSLSGGVSMNTGKILVRDLHAEGDPGVLDADVLIAPGDNRLRMKTSLFPSRLAPAFLGKTSESLSSMDFQDPLQISFEGSAPAIDPLRLNGKGTLSLGKASMRGSRITGLSSQFQVADGSVDFRNINVGMSEGTGSGEFIFDYKNWEGRFPMVHTTLDPVKVMMWIDPRIAGALTPYRFKSPPETRLSGKVGLRNPEQNDLRILVNSTTGLNYTLLGKDLPFGKTSGTVTLKSQNINVDIPASKLFGGDVSLRVDASVAAGNASYGASVHLEDVDFTVLTDLYFGYGSSHGKLTADYAFRTVGGDDLAMTGKGSLLIKNGKIVDMPILGPLSGLLNDIIPGIGYEPARKATADFTVDHGVITTRNLLIQGVGFSMIGNGSIHYLEDRMDMNVRLNAQGLPGVVLFPVSKILEYESVSSPKHPKWRPKILPRLGPSQRPIPSTTP